MELSICLPSHPTHNVCDALLRVAMIVMFCPETTICIISILLTIAGLRLHLSCTPCHATAHYTQYTSTLDRPDTSIHRLFCRATRNMLTYQNECIVPQ